MPSVFAWLDASERDRRRALDVIDLFQQKETVDELGLGSVRDTVADVLAPGTSTIQTRARYFLFISWIYQAIEQTNSGRPGVAAEARKAETRLMAELAEAPEPQGTIGLRAGPSLRRLPSTVYWSGLRRLGFRLLNGGISHYHRSIERAAPVRLRDESGDQRVDAPPHGTNWNPHLPLQPDGFPSSCTFQLTEAESVFFRDQLRMHASGSLLHFLVERGEKLTDIELPWEHPALHEMPTQLQEWLHHAQCFSELMHGVQLLYNVLLAEQSGKEDLVQQYSANMTDWAARTTERRQGYSEWNRAEFWSRLRRVNLYLPRAVEEFSESWIKMALNIDSASQYIADRTTRTLLANREHQLKGPRARLLNRTQLDTWGGASGTAALNYRWYITRTMVNDIVDGFGR
jgi:hypothetical protein